MGRLFFGSSNKHTLALCIYLKVIIKNQISLPMIIQSISSKNIFPGVLWWSLVTLVNVFVFTSRHLSLKSILKHTQLEKKRFQIKPMALFISVACFNFYHICINWQSTLWAIIVLMAWNQYFTIVEQVLSLFTLNLWIKTKLHPAMHLVSCAMLTDEQLLTIRALCLCETVQDLMVSLLIDGETLGNVLLPGGHFMENAVSVLTCTLKSSVYMHWWTWVLEDHVSLPSWFWGVKDLSVKK